MRYARKTALAFLIAFSLLVTACPASKNLADISHTVIVATDTAIPIFQANGLDTAKLVRVRAEAVKAEAAFREQRTDDAVGYAATAIRLFNEVVGGVEIIKDKTIRTIVMLGLVALNVALSRLASKLAAAAPNAGGVSLEGSETAAIAVFATKKKWRCRDSISGQFKKMEACKASPSTTTVEVR